MKIRSAVFVAALVAPAVLRAQQPALAPSPVARIEVTPRSRELVAGDSIVLQARALDRNGAMVRDARIFFTQRGARFEGRIDSTGKVVASSVGKMPLHVTAIVPGTLPVIDSSLEIRVLPGRATRIEVEPRTAKLVRGQQLRVSAVPLSRANDRSHEQVTWSSSTRGIATVNDDGLITAVAPGRSTITATAGAATTTIGVEVVSSSITQVAIAPARPAVRQGDVVRFTVSARDAAGASVSGLTPTWSFSPGDGQIGPDGAFVAYRPGDYLVTANLGAKTASTVVHVAERNVRRRLTVVGRLPRTQLFTSEVWIHPNGRVAYLSTISGGDRVYSVDISDPAHPSVVDSIMVNARAVNDVLTTADGNTLILTREGAADRKNGIVIADTHDPLHPREISQFVNGVSSGVHSLYVYENPKFGRFVFLTNDGTGAIDVVDISDPAHPVRAGEWRTNRPDAARFVHDLDIVDGLLYASYWNDGLVILDIGNGIKGGTPRKPVLVSQFKYDLDSLYRDVEHVGGPGFIRGTHTAWRQRDGKYVFIGDEVFPASGVKGAKDASSSRAYGTLQVLDVSDIEHPKAVAWYTPENGGVHNVWVVKDTLYIGAYDAGFHAFDVSGELRGDLRAQSREIASLNTADTDGKVPNAAFDWGVVVNPKDGLAYVNDFFNGLWIVRIEPKPTPVP